MIGKRIKQRRSEIGLTLLELSKTIGLSESTIQRYESGEIKNLKYGTILKLAEALYCTPSFLMGWDDGFRKGYETALENTEDEDIEEKKEKYYLNPETVKVAQEIFEDKELRLLFDTARDSSPEDLRTIHEMLKALKRKEKGNYWDEK